jgi:hypothetical protein
MAAFDDVLEITRPNSDDIPHSRIHAQNAMDRGMLRYAIAATLLSVAVVPAAAQSASQMMTVREFFVEYDRAGRDGQAILDLGIRGFLSALTWTNTYLQRVRKQEPLFCQPADVQIEPVDMVRLLRNSANTSAWAADAPFGAGIIATLKAAYPCQAGSGDHGTDDWVTPPQPLQKR